MKAVGVDVSCEEEMERFWFRVQLAQVSQGPRWLLRTPPCQTLLSLRSLGDGSWTCGSGEALCRGHHLLQGGSEFINKKRN